MKDNTVNAFARLMDLVDKNDKYCVWVKSHSTESYAQELIKEINELLAGIKSRDLSNIREEMADILWDAVVLAKIAEREYNFDFETAMNSLVEKIQRRKPYIFEEREATMEEAVKLWKEAKEKEKKIKNKEK